ENNDVRLEVGSLKAHIHLPLDQPKLPCLVQGRVFSPLSDRRVVGFNGNHLFRHSRERNREKSGSGIKLQNVLRRWPNVFQNFIYKWRKQKSISLEERVGCKPIS